MNLHPSSTPVVAPYLFRHPRPLAGVIRLAAVAAIALMASPVGLLAQGLEKTELKTGFIKLTDCAPLVIAKEKGFFRDEGLSVEVVAQPNWKTLLDNVISGNLDGAHMLSGQPIAATIGIGTQAHVVTAFTMDLNGNGITVSNAVWESMQLEDPSLDTPTPPHPITAKAMRPIVNEYLAKGQKLQMGMVFPVSTHNYELRYWLAAAGIHPGFYSGADVGGRTGAEVEVVRTGEDEVAVPGLNVVAGVGNGTYIFCLPGCTGACKDGWDKLIVSELDYRTRPCNLVELMPRLLEK